MTIDNRKANATPISRELINQARAAKQIVFRIGDVYLVRRADPSHAIWCKLKPEANA